MPHLGVVPPRFGRVAVERKWAWAHLIGLGLLAGLFFASLPLGRLFFYAAAGACLALSVLAIWLRAWSERRAARSSSDEAAGAVSDVASAFPLLSAGWLSMPRRLLSGKTISFNEAVLARLRSASSEGGSAYRGRRPVQFRVRPRAERIEALRRTRIALEEAQLESERTALEPDATRHARSRA